MYIKPVLNVCKMLQPKYTMHGFEWKEQRGIEGTGFVRTLRSLLTAHLPSVYPSLSKTIAESIESEISISSEGEGTSSITAG